MDRGPARAPDRRQSFARAAPQSARRHRRRRPHPWRSTTNSSTTTAPICARTPPPCPISPPPCCPAPIACRPIAPSATSASPTRRPAAPIARPAATNPPSCASGYSTPSPPRSAWTKSKSAAAISSPKARCPTRSASTRWARRSSTTPATMQACSTRRWRSPTGTICSSNSRERRRARRKSRRRAWPSSWRKADSARSTPCASKLSPAARSRSSPASPRSAKASRPSIAQICADALGVDYSDIRVIHGQTDRIDNGMGAFASRVTVMCGEATRLAATKLRAQVARARRRTAADASADLLDIVDGKIVRRNRRARGLFDARSRELVREQSAAGSPPRRPSNPRTWSTPTASTSPSCASMPTPAASPSSAMPSPTTSARRSIRCWSKARSPAAWRRGSAARCWRSFSTTTTASRCRSASPII